MSFDKDIYIFPVSFAQQRLWFLDQFEPSNPFYNTPSAVRIEGVVQVAALEQSLHELVRRHEALRTTFAMIDGEPSQVIHPFMHITLEKVDLRELSKKEREAEAFRLALEEAQQPESLHLKIDKKVS